MFSRDRLVDTLAAGYFPMLGVLSGDPKGLQLLERWRMFNMMYHIVDLKQRPDLIKLLLSNFDYSIQGHPRVLLSKALTAGTKDIRIHATNALRKHAVRPIPSSNSQGGVSDSKWAIQLLVTQLYDPEIDVCATAVKILEKASNRKTYLEYIVECRPSLDHLGEIGGPLLLRFLSTSIGYHYLDGLDYISNEMDDWFLGRNDTYVSVIEASLARTFLDNPNDQSHRISLFDAAEEEEAEFHDSHVPPHFYRELTRTEEGCRLLSDKGHFEEFVTTIRNHGMQCEDPDLIKKVKGCLWAVGNVGSMELGAPFLEASDVVELIITIAESHEVMSLRGTAFFVLGLISRSTHGLEILSEHGWESNTTPLGNSLGFCIPTDLSKLFSLVPWKAENATSMTLLESQRTSHDPPGVHPYRVLEPSDEASLATEAELNRRILALIVDLGNMILYKKAVVELQKLKQRKPTAFQSKRFFKEVLALMEWNHYRLGVRRMVIDLFDKKVMRQIVFDEEDTESSDSSDDEEEDEDEDEDEEEEEEANGSGQVEESSSGDDRTERQRSISEPMEYKKEMAPQPLRLRR